MIWTASSTLIFLLRQVVHATETLIRFWPCISRCFDCNWVDRKYQHLQSFKTVNLRDLESHDIISPSDKRHMASIKTAWAARSRYLKWEWVYSSLRQVLVGSAMSTTSADADSRNCDWQPHINHPWNYNNGFLGCLCNASCREDLAESSISRTRVFTRSSVSYWHLHIYTAPDTELIDWEGLADLLRPPGTPRPPY